MAKFFKSGLCILILFMFIMGFAGCSENSTGAGTESKTSTSTADKTKAEWTTVIDFDGGFSDGKTEAFSDVFELTGGEVRITYDLVTTSAGGNAMIYVLPEGWTKTKDADGNLKVSVQDVTAIGDKTGEQKTVKKDAGKYFIDINTSSVESYKIKIEEKK